MDTEAFSRAFQQELQAFEQVQNDTSVRELSTPRHYQHKPVPREYSVLVVKLVVRRYPLADDHDYFHITDTLSTVEAEIEARKAARKDGYPCYQETLYIKRGMAQNPKIVSKH